MDTEKKSLPPRYEIILFLCRGGRPFSIYLYTKRDTAPVGFSSTFAISLLRLSNLNAYLSSLLSRSATLLLIPAQTDANRTPDNKNILCPVSLNRILGILHTAYLFALLNYKLLIYQLLILLSLYFHCCFNAFPIHGMHTLLPCIYFLTTGIQTSNCAFAGSGLR